MNEIAREQSNQFKATASGAPDLGGLEELHDGASTVALGAELFRNQAEKLANASGMDRESVDLLDTASRVAFLAKTHLECVRRQIRYHYVSAGQTPPPLFHKENCPCDSCATLKNGEEHGG